MIPRKLRVRRKTQKILNRRINSWRASIACAGFIRLSTFSLRSRSIAASSRTSRLRVFHFAYLLAPMPSARSTDTIQTVMSVAVTRSIAIKSERQWNVFFSGESSTQGRFSCPRKEVRIGRQFDLPATERKISPMRSHGGVLVVVCTGVCFASAHWSRAQEATSSNLPDQFQTGEMIQIHKPKKKKAETTSQTLATVPTQDTAPVPEHTLPAAEEVPTQIAPAEEKKAEPNGSTASMPPSQKETTPIEQAPSAEESPVVALPEEKKPRAKKRRRPAVQPEAASISAPVPVSLSVAQSMAITAPLPDYKYEMKRRNLTGSGVCLVTVDPATGTVSNAIMFQSTGSPLLDKITTETFKSWRFKPGTVSQVRVPISYE